MNKKIFNAAAVLLLACATLGGCAGGGDPGENPGGNPPDSGITDEKNLLVQENDVVKSVVEVGSVTGSKSPWNDTVTGYGVGGTDLGIPVYDSKNERMLLLYGDTFSGQNKGEGSGYNDWRSNVCAYSTDFNLSDGLTLDGWITRPNREQAKQIVPSQKTDGVEITTIPTGAVELGGNIYMFYMSVRKWGGNGEWWVNYCGLTKSTDGGENYTQVDSVYFAGIKDQTTVNVTGKTSAEIKAHYAPGFCQVWPMIAGDYVYFYGIEGGRFGGVQLARVKSADIENFDQYEYYTGKKNDGSPVFLQGAEGLKAVSAEDNASAYIMEGPAGEMCVVYNKYLNKFITIYQKGTVMVFRTSENPWGDWSKPLNLVGYDTYNAMYCGFMHEKYTEQDGKIVYFMMSYWWDYESILMKLELY